MRKSKGYRSRTRKLLSKKARTRGKIGLSRLLISYNPGDRVCIKIDPAVHKGMPHKRFHGRVGKISEKRGRSYVVDVPLGSRMAQVIARPEHIQSFGG
ncbi:MAG: 50S ribosomal protein L21e [archaeon]